MGFGLLLEMYVFSFIIRSDSVRLIQVRTNAFLSVAHFSFVPELGEAEQCGSAGDGTNAFEELSVVVLNATVSNSSESWVLSPAMAPGEEEISSPKNFEEKKKDRKKGWGERGMATKLITERAG